MRRRGRSRYSPPQHRAGSVLMGAPRSKPRSARRRHSGGRRGGGGRGGLGRLIVLAALVVVAVIVFLSMRSGADAREERRDAAIAFMAAWTKDDYPRMYAELTPRKQQERTQSSFIAAYERLVSKVGVRSVRVGRPAKERDGRIAFPTTVGTRDFGTLRGTIALPVTGAEGNAGVTWSPELRLPGLRRGETISVQKGRQPERGDILAADGTPLAGTALGASIAGKAGAKPTGLQRIHDDELAGTPSRRLLFGTRVRARVDSERGRSVRTTIRPGLSRRANAALGDKTGGIAVIRPRDGAVLALAGLAVSAPQPPGSTFKIVTTAAALKNGVATPRSRYPVQTSTRLSGVTLRNAGGEACGGTLAESFTESCNSVFAPLGAKLGRNRLLATAEAFGFNQRLSTVPAVKMSTISKDLRDDIALGSAAIGQERDLATPLQMASVAATIATDGRRVRPRLAESDAIRSRRVVSERIAHQIRDMMISVVRSGTGKSAALDGVQVAGKTGTAELRANSRAAEDANAWFVAFAPAGKPKVAVAVMLVGGGFGGDSAAPVAKQVLAAALE